MPVIFHNIGLALLTILIPLAIAVLSDYYNKRSDRSDFVELDLLVILDRVFQIRRLVLFSLMIFSPFIFWEFSHAYLRIIEVFLSLIGIFFLVKITWNVYRWTKGDIFSYRFSYLEKLEESSDFEKAWKSVWSSKNIDLQNEIKFFEIFSKKIDKMVKAK
ncbi:MAG: hypothetical protein QXZ02_05115 [Candidatus Bathyarchaeia archaeon]